MGQFQCSFLILNDIHLTKMEYKNFRKRKRSLFRSESQPLLIICGFNELPLNNVNINNEIEGFPILETLY